MLSIAEFISQFAEKYSVHRKEDVAAGSICVKEIVPGTYLMSYVEVKEK